MANDSRFIISSVRAGIGTTRFRQPDSFAHQYRETPRKTLDDYQNVLNQLPHNRNDSLFIDGRL